VEIENVIVYNGNWDGATSGNALQGKWYQGFRSAIHSKINYYNNNHYWWSHGDPQGLFYQGQSYNFKHLVGTTWQFFKGTIPNSGYLNALFTNYDNVIPSYQRGVPPGFPPGYLQFSYKNEKTLMINPISNDSKTTLIQFNDVRHTETNTPIWFGNRQWTGFTGAADNQAIFSGNAAGCLHKITNSGGDLYMTNYQDYIKSDQFKANFDYFVNRQTIIVLTVTYKGLFTNPLSRVKISGYPTEQGAGVDPID